MLRTITLILFYLGWHISKHLLFPLPRVKLKVLFTSFMTISFFDVFETEILIDFSIKLMWDRNIVFHLITFIQYNYLQICLQFTLTLSLSILTNITPPNCIIYCNLCVASRTKVYFNQFFLHLFEQFWHLQFFSNEEAFSSSLVNLMLILLFLVTVVDSVNFKMGLFINFRILIFLKL